MDLWFSALLGLVQGLTEFLPISSTAHLRILPSLLGQPDPGAAFTAVIQLGTLAAVLAYFARDLFWVMPRAVVREPRSPEARRFWLIGLGTVPIAVLGVLAKDLVTGELRSLVVVAVALAAVGALFLWVDRRPPGSRSMGEMCIWHAGWIGVAQAAALIPGVSRSGATILAAIIVGYRRPDAARFSFLLGVPAILGAGLFELPDAIRSLGSGAYLSLGVGIVTAWVSGYAAIAWFIAYLGRRGLAPFGWYRIALGLLLLALVAGGVISATG